MMILVLFFFLFLNFFTQGSKDPRGYYYYYYYYYYIKVRYTKLTFALTLYERSLPVQIGIGTSTHQVDELLMFQT